MAYQTKQSIEAERRRQLEIAAGLMSDRFPQVASIRLEVTFHDAEGRPVQRRLRMYPETEYALFEVRCPLDNSTVDLKPVISKMVSAKEKHRTDELGCNGAPDNGIAAHHLVYDVAIEYKVARKKAAPTKGRTKKKPARAAR